eukprot:756210-Hanusia_phi.AAC.2
MDRRLAGFQSGSLLVGGWDGEVHKKLDVSSGYVRDVSWGPDGNTFASICSSGKVDVWDVASLSDKYKSNCQYVVSPISL